tara:strand:+ start:45 stop:218 length:174 start_codon:yes stop_codon:yes gene_type:complete
MKKQIGKVEVELSGSLITVKVDGELRGAKDVNPLNAIEKYKEICGVYQKSLLSGKHN